MDNILNKYDKIFVDTSAFLRDKDNIFKTNSTARYLESIANDSLQNDFFTEKLYKVLINSGLIINTNGLGNFPVYGVADDDKGGFGKSRIIIEIGPSDFGEGYPKYMAKNNQNIFENICKNLA